MTEPMGRWRCLLCPTPRWHKAADPDQAWKDHYANTHREDAR